MDSGAIRALGILGQIPFPLELLDREFHVLFCNAAYRRQFGAPPRDEIGELQCLLPSEIEGLSRDQIVAQAEQEESWKGEARIRTQERGEVPFRVRLFPVDHPELGGKAYAACYEDIGREVAAREALAHQRYLVEIRLRQAQAGELLSMIAHQWRQPLTAVMSLIGNIQLKTQMGPLPADYLQSKLEKMAQSVQFLSETIDVFRNFYTASKHKSVEDLSVLVHRALDLVNPALVTLHVDVETRFPQKPASARVFPGEFMQVVLELIGNARAALSAVRTGSGRLLIALEADERWVWLRLENNGTPIPAEVLPHLYDPYYPLRDGVQTGLGLYMAKLIVESHHGGTLEVESQDGINRFSCSIPRGIP